VRRLPPGPPGGEYTAFHPRRPLLAVSRGHLIDIIDLETGHQEAEYEGTADITAVEWHPDGTRLVAACASSRLHVWDLADDRGSDPLRTRMRVGKSAVPTPVLDGHRTAGIHAAFDSSGSLLVSNDWDQLVRVWDVPSGQPLLTAPFPMPTRLRAD